MHGGALLDNLAALGRRPEEIEAVAFTHLHPDHIGWAWHPAPGGDRPPFAHADYLMSEPEWAHRDVLEAQGMSKEMAGLAPSVRTVADGQEIFPGVRMRIGAGHTPGHAEYVITSGGQRLIAFGDAMLSSIQVEHPEWPLAFDGDPSRRPTIAAASSPTWRSPTRSVSASTSRTWCSDMSGGTATAPLGVPWTPHPSVTTYEALLPCSHYLPKSTAKRIRARPARATRHCRLE